MTEINSKQNVGDTSVNVKKQRDYYGTKKGDKAKDGQEIEEVYFADSQYIIYGVGGIVGFENEPGIDKDFHEIADKICKIRFFTNNNYHSRNWINLEIATSIKACFDNDIEQSKKILNNIGNNINEQRSFIIKYLAGSVFLMIVNIIISVLIKVNYTFIKPIIGDEVITLFYIVTFGSIGGILSIYFKINDIDTFPGSKSWHTFFIGVFRVLIAMICSVIIYFAIKSNIVLGFINSNPTYIFLMSIISGFSEILVRNLIKTVEKGTSFKKGASFKISTERDMNNPVGDNR